MSVYGIESDIGNLATRRQKQVLWSFTLTLFTSALLLFGVQPLFAKIVLPVLGGSTAVWSIALVFFQGVLLLGYLYAHLISKYLPVKAAIIVHLLVLVSAFAFLPLTFPAGWTQPPQTGLSLWLVGLFAVGVGFPFFAVSANAPLLQSWFARTGHPHSNDPYFLYGASNIGSFVALLAYPFIIEPLSSVHSQTFGWSAIYGVLCLAVALCGVILWQLAGKNVVKAEEISSLDDKQVTAISNGQRLSWIGLAMIPSGLLVSLTAFIATDLVSAPFLWVLPLALFLLTFVIAFQRKPILPHSMVLKIHAFLVAPAVILLFVSKVSLSQIPLHMIVFFISAMVCHGELVKRRPDSAHLTEFYLLMSLGGVIGGILASLVAPAVLDRVLEYPVLLALVFACRPEVTRAFARHEWKKFKLLLLIIPIVVLSMFSMWQGAFSLAVNLLILLCAVGAVILYKKPVQAACLVGVGMTLILVNLHQPNTVAQVRSFFGVKTVIASQNNKYHVLVHGTTYHGAEQVLDDDGEAIEGRPEPLAYYYRQGGLAVAVDTVRAANGSIKDVAIVGLGSGAMACLRPADESWKYYEIDPEMVNIARDRKLFSYLSRCGESAGIVVGDGRIALAKEDNAKFDLIVLDAFSSDSIPVHLITKEAFQLYFDKLKPGGSMVLHISNQYLELASVISSIADSLGAKTVISTRKKHEWKHDEKNFRFAPVVAVVSKSQKVMDSFGRDKRWFSLDRKQYSKVWSDDYSNIIGSIYRRAKYGIVPAQYR